MHDVVILGASILGLALGPVVSRVAGAHRGWVLALDGYMLVSLGGIGLVFLLPMSVATAGPMAALLAAVGLFLPSYLERRTSQAHGATFAIVMLGLLFHSAMDGAALSAPVAGHDHGLDLAVILHRLPIGLLVYVNVQQTRGSRAAIGMVSLLAVSTCLGFWAGDAMGAHAQPYGLALFEAFVVGGLLHVVMHRQELANCGHDHHHGSSADNTIKPEQSPQQSTAPEHPEHPEHHAHHQHHAHPEHHAHHEHHQHHEHHEHHQHHEHHEHHEHQGQQDQQQHAHQNEAPLWGVVGALLGGLTLFFIGEAPESAQRAAKLFLKLSLEAAPALLAAYATAGLLNAFLVPKTVRWLGKGNRMSQSVRGMAFGLPLPICSCGVLPLYQTLIERGVPATAAMAFLVATPELGLDAVLISFPLLGTQLTIARLLAAVCIALIAALIVSHFVESQHQPSAESQDQVPPLTERLRAGFRYGFGALVDHTMPWMLVGLAVAAFADPLLDTDLISTLKPVWQVPFFALLGIPLYVCASGATPLAAVAIVHHVSPGAALAFLLTGPATNATTFGVLKSLHGARVATLFGVSVTTLAIIVGWLTNLWLGDVIEANTLSATAPVLNVIALGALTFLLTVSLLRQGPRGMINQIFHPIDLGVR
jgi:uncharacterized membrane protein YraQ (UPF0718 family)